MRVVIALLLGAALAGAASSKLPALTDEAKAKAAEAAARTAWSNKVSDYQTCKAMERVAAKYLADAKKAGKDVQPTETPACVDPGPFSYTPAAAPPAAASAAPAGPAAPAAAAPAPAAAAAPPASAASKP